MESSTCISFFQFERLPNKVRAFGMMQFAHKHLQNIKGLQFYKLMGTGKGNGFNPFPDWGTYSLLTVWDTEEDARHFIDQSNLYAIYRALSKEIYTVYMKCVKTYGLWSGIHPFEADTSLQITDQDPICAITRATIKKRQLRKFWKNVPYSSEALKENDALLFTKGIGEVPIIQMATFSIWRDLASLKDFAYSSKGHQNAIKLTRKVDWYSEELFARFIPIKTEGSWHGERPINL